MAWLVAGVVAGLLAFGVILLVVWVCGSETERKVETLTPEQRRTARVLQLQEEFQLRGWGPREAYAEAWKTVLGEEAAARARAEGTKTKPLAPVIELASYRGDREDAS